MLFEEDTLLAALRRHPISKADQDFIYGTAGFRTAGERLYGIAFRIGILAALRSMQERGAVIGVIVTASHNKASDNGLKVVDKGGEMLDESWEEIAVQFTRVSIAEVPDFIREVCRNRNIDLAVRGRVFLGEDNRLTSPVISDIVSKGVVTVCGTCTNFGQVTTPQLHFLVYKQNILEPQLPVSSIDCYFQKICNSFIRLQSRNNNNNASGLISPLYVDCANGVGAQHLMEIKSRLQAQLKNVYICNRDPCGKTINLHCGADYIKTKLKFPTIHNGDVLEIGENQRWASIDGDADRLVYFFKKDQKLFILDGDKQAVIVAKYIKEQLETVGSWGESGLKLGVVQTAYANSSCTQALTKFIGVPVTCVPTGVKYLHHVGKEFDIRIYFEANGHGSIILSPSARSFLRDHLKEDHPLKNVLLDGLVNEAVGDSFSILLLIEHIVQERGLSLQEWYDVYSDLPSSLLQVRIKDRRVITTTDSERRVLRPERLQHDIDEKIKEIGSNLNSRAFVRPSGTEDIVRVYAESESEEVSIKIGVEVARLVYDQVGGVGGRP